jgi:hypothetical protein
MIVIDTIRIKTHIILDFNKLIKATTNKTNKLCGLSSRANYTDRSSLVGELVPTVGDRGCHVVSVTDSYGHILYFLDWSRYFSFQVAPQLYSRG